MSSRFTTITEKRMFDLKDLEKMMGNDGGHIFMMCYFEGPNDVRKFTEEVSKEFGVFGFRGCIGGYSDKGDVGILCFRKLMPLFMFEVLADIANELEYIRYYHFPHLSEVLSLITAGKEGEHDNSN